MDNEIEHEQYPSSKLSMDFAVSYFSHLNTSHFNITVNNIPVKFNSVIYDCIIGEAPFSFTEKNYPYMYILTD